MGVKPSGGQLALPTTLKSLASIVWAGTRLPVVTMTRQSPQNLAGKVDIRDSIATRGKGSVVGRFTHRFSQRQKIPRAAEVGMG